jgi:hypothetical protein
MVHLLQISVILTAIALLALGIILYNEYYNPATKNVTEIIEIIANQSGLSGSVGGGVTVGENGSSVSTNATGPQLLILNNNTDIQILQNELNGTEYTAILFTNS